MYFRNRIGNKCFLHIEERCTYVTPKYQHHKLSDEYIKEYIYMKSCNMEGICA